jgi:hypothetical protein
MQVYDSFARSLGPLTAFGVEEVGVPPGNMSLNLLLVALPFKYFIKLILFNV